MTIHVVNHSNLMLHITPKDLRPLSIQLQDLNQSHALHLAKCAFHSLGTSIQNQFSIEVYPTSSGALIFAQLHTKTLTWFQFYHGSDLAPLLLPLVTSGSRCSITYFQHTYFLAVPSDQTHTILLLNQFLSPLSTLPDFTLSENTPQSITFDPCILLDFPPF